MIAKHVPMKSIKKSDFDALVSYISDDQDKKERVEYTSVTNCQSEDLTAAIIEVTAVQGMNTRAESDKTYHLILSFREGERPSNEVLKEIERSICEGLGYGEHQRVSAVHCDTDNLHMHIAINKIHPTRLTIHNSYNDHKVLGKLCEAIEIKYGLERDNHQSNKVASENRAADMERHAGVESLLSWVRRECLDQLHAAASWDEFHKVLREHGLTLQERGNGFVIADHDGLMVKASTVARDLSKGKLEGRLGVFESLSKDSGVASQSTGRGKVYEPRPVGSRLDTTLLFARYKNEQANQRALRAQQWKSVREERARKIDAAKRAAKLKRAVIKLSTKSRIEKKILYALASKSLLADIQHANQQCQAERQAIFERHRPQQWADWLRRKASSGDVDALNALRARDAAQGLSGDTIGGIGGARIRHGVKVKLDGVTKKGTIIYRAGSSAIRDDGDKLKVSRGSSADGLEVALRMAMERYGSTITVSGSAEFKARIVRTAVDAGIPLVFADPVLERQRRSLLNNTTVNRNEQLSERGRGIGSGVSGIGSGVHNANGAGRWYGFFGAINKPNVSGVGRRPPPESRNRLRDLSSLAMVRFAAGVEMLLSGNVSGGVEQQGAERNNALRRSVSGAGLIVFVEADKYIAEREEKRLRGINVPMHRRYSEGDAGTLSFAGLRRVDGTALLLLKRDDVVCVLPVDEPMAARLQRLSIGDAVSVGESGSITLAKGRSR
ncbi:TraI/MobA(P) family conjugative relaxase [Methylomonas sp. OY6]|uniref:TraI/MobA(P) family conjugative relaxase n=1 Tax=Methylomonas defluvii TaxID=3045149 RepID=A0ABU4UJW8_9GAMM|nr:TraI/MobA(P) family conjugative relaxase [Methylomonas sp. OY6]MDX8129579.1 TraI/MobA(P) family conjugative relaxase [Methylomonas sp. OY6]